MSTRKSGKTAKNEGLEPAFEAERRAVLAEALKLAPFDGWSAQSLRNAGEAAGVDSATLKAAFPEGVANLLQFWSEAHDDAMAAAMAAPDFKGLKIREKVAFAVRARLDAMSLHKEAARRAAATLSLPHMAPLASKLVWKTADRIWRGLGDKSTDFNFYSKRAILSGVWTSTFARWLADNSEDEAATDKFLAARIDNVMQIEKVKGRVRELGLDPSKPIEWLARIRYPSSGR